MENASNIKGVKWCPETDLNRRHADFQADFSATLSNPSTDRSRQTARRETTAYRQFVKPSPQAEKKNLGALAGATEADCEVSHFKNEPYRKAPNPSNKKASGSLAKFIQPQHKRMSRMLGYCLTVEAPTAWHGFSFVAAARLSRFERVSLAFAALNAVDADDAEMTAAAVIGSAGDPLPCFLGGMEDARIWASWASRSELKAYALACFEAMTPKDQAAFFRHIGSVEVKA